MGIIIILFILPITILLLIGMLIKTIRYINKTKDYKSLSFGFLFGIVEMIIIITFWSIEGEVYAFSPIFTTFYWITLLSIITIVLSFIPNYTIKKVSNVFSASLVTFILLTFILVFTSTALFELLNIKTYH